ncbi:MAG: long-chain-fatty-acid--CoA ligase [Planctomycetes bacterium]|nr:long-chain-fatty-acid--CoA ligase [Planctomycetota bacterium]
MSNLWSSLERAARLHPDAIAVVDGARSYTYREFRARAAALALWLDNEGVKRGDRISILSWNSHYYLECYFAAAGLGLVLNPLNTRLHAREIEDIVRDCGARVLLAQAGFESIERALKEADTPVRLVARLGESLEPALQHWRSGSDAFVPIETDADDVAQLYYTSGTTGVAKGVMLSHRNVLVHAQGAIAELGLSERDTWAHIAPLFHLADAWATFAITHVGGRHVVLPKFEAEGALTLIEASRTTITNLIPTMLNLMVKHPSASGRDFRALRLILSGGAPIAPDVVRAILAVFGCDYVQTYGMTETSPYLTLSLLHEHLKTLPPEEQLAYKCKTGRAFTTIELRVVDEQGRDVPRDERTVGEIRVRGETVTRGYWNRPDETARAFEDGWLKTGDLAVIDAEGYVTIVDRAKDMILSGGENVYSTEVENALYAHPAVLEAAVFGVPDERLGEAVRAAVVLRAETHASAADLIAFCRTQIAAYKAPRAIDFVAELPRTGSGKIQKRALREAFGRGRERAL